jgi:hypothetical protein
MFLTAASCSKRDFYTHIPPPTTHPLKMQKSFVLPSKIFVLWCMEHAFAPLANFSMPSRTFACGRGLTLLLVFAHFCFHSSTFAFICPLSYAFTHFPLHLRTFICVCALLLVGLRTFACVSSLLLAFVHFCLHLLMFAFVCLRLLALACACAQSLSKSSHQLFFEYKMSHYLNGTVVIFVLPSQPVTSPDLYNACWHHYNANVFICILCT